MGSVCDSWESRLVRRARQFLTAIHSEEEDRQLGHKTEPQLFRFETPAELVALGG